MKGFKKLLSEMNFTLNSIEIFNDFLNGVMIFLIAFFVLSIFDLNPIYALVPSVIYIMVYLYIKLGKDKGVIVESHYDILKEKLRTAEDNIKLENPVVDELQSEIMKDMKTVRVSSFLNIKSISFKIIGTIAMCFMIVIFAFFNINFITIKDFLGGALGIDEPSKSEIIGTNIVPEVNLSEDIYGKESVAKLGNMELGIKIQPVGYKVNVRETGKAEQRVFTTTFPSEVFVESASVYEEKIPQEDHELVKNYFKKLAE